MLFAMGAVRLAQRIPPPAFPLDYRGTQNRQPIDSLCATWLRARSSVSSVICSLAIIAAIERASSRGRGAIFLSNWLSLIANRDTFSLPGQLNSISPQKNCCLFFHRHVVFFLTLALWDSIHSSTAKFVLQNRCKSIERENRKMATKKAAKKAPAKKAAKKTAKKK